MAHFNDPNVSDDWSPIEEFETLYRSLETDDQDDVLQTAGDLFAFLARDDVREILVSFAIDSETQLYQDMEGELEIPADALSERLQELTEIDILHRTSYDGVPAKTEYRLTEKARDVFAVILEANKWSMGHDLEP